MDGPLIGRIVLYFALAWSLFVSVKAFYELHKTANNGIDDLIGSRESNVKKRSNIVILLAIGFYNIYNIFAYVWFDIADTGLRIDDRTIGIFNILFMNVIWLYLIFKIRQKREGTFGKDKFTMSELLKF